MPTLQVIADAEVQPGAIVSSSLMTRMRDNNAASFNAVFNREAGDFPLVFFDFWQYRRHRRGYTFSAISGFSGPIGLCLRCPASVMSL